MRLKELRRNRKLKQIDLAEVLNCSQGVYSRYENEEREPPFDIIKKLADYYDVTVDYIFGREEVQAEEKESTFNVNTQQDRDPIFDAIAKLNPENRALVDQMARKLLESQRRNSGT